MNLTDLESLLDDPAHISILGTADADGLPNSAIFGSARLVDGQIVIGCGNSRTLANLRVNPRATLMVVVPGTSVLNYRGTRLQLRCTAIEESGPALEAVRDAVRAAAGRGAARMIRCLLRFEISATRDLVDRSLIFTAD